LPWNWLAADDLTHWQMRTPAAVNQVRYLNNLFVAVGTNIMTSLDGANWTSHSSSGAVLNSAIYVPYGYYLAGGSALWASTNGSTWTNVPASLPEFFSDIAWHSFQGGVFVATPGLYGSPGRVYSSTNLLNWAPVLLTTEFQFHQFQYGMKKVIRAFNSLWIVGGGSFDDHILVSSTGTNWFYSAYANQYPGDFVFANGILVFIGREGCPLRYTGGWSPIPDPSYCPLPPNSDCLLCHYGDGATFGDQKWVSVIRYPEGTRILASTDLQKWQQRTLVYGASLNSIAYGAGCFVAAGESGIWQSVPVVIPQLSLVRKSSTGLAVRVAAEVGYNHTLQYSYNFSNWQDQQVFFQLTPIMEFPEPLNLQLPSKFLRVRSP
jgi:hypothetical protein